MSGETLLAAALAYAARGFRVIPLHHPVRNGTIRCSCGNTSAAHARFIGKHPRLAEWPQSATTDAAQIHQWWQTWPQANIALITGGASGLAILDVDPRNGGDVSLEDLQRLRHPLPDTPIVLSGGGGQHYYFRTPHDLPCPKLAPGLDFLGDGGHYALAPPSLHLSGNLYVWELSATLEETPLAEIPAWLLELVEAMAQTYTQAARELPDELPDIELAALHISPRMQRIIAEGNDLQQPYPSRSEAVFAVLQALIHAGYDDATIAAILLNPQWGISEKPLEQKNPRSPNYWRLTLGWVAREISRARAKASRGLRQPEPRETPAPPPGPLLDTYGLGYQDAYNARALLDTYGTDLRYCYDWGAWLAWRGTSWALAGHEPMWWAQQAIIRLAHNAGALQDERAITALMKHVTASLRAGRLQAMLTMAMNHPDLQITHTQLETHPFLLNCANGTLDLRSGTLRPHAREDFLTHCLTVPFVPDAPCSRWKAFLWTIFDHNQDLIRFVQRLLGYCLTGSVQEQLLFVFWGSGANGKSTLVNTLLTLLGSLSMKATDELLMLTRGERHPTERADLFRKRLVATIETREGHGLNETLVKEATGGDPIRARRMHENFWQFDPTHKFVLATNHKPVIRGTDHAIWRRIALVPFQVTIAEKDRNPHLSQELAEEAPGILAWLVRGCREWLEAGLGMTESVRTATGDYRQEMDLVGRFLAEACVLLPDAACRATTLYKAYQEWCESNGERWQAQRWFGMQLTGRSFQSYKNNVTYWKGIGLLHHEGGATG